MFNSSTQVSLRPIVMKSPPDFPHQTPGTVRHAPNTRHCETRTKHQNPVYARQQTQTNTKHQAQWGMHQTVDQKYTVRTKHHTLVRVLFSEQNFSETGSGTFFWDPFRYHPKILKSQERDETNTETQADTKMLTRNYTKGDIVWKVNVGKSRDREVFGTTFFRDRFRDFFGTNFFWDWFQDFFGTNFFRYH